MASNTEGMQTTKRQKRPQRPQVTLEILAYALQHPRLDIPYFSHEPLDPQVYPGDIGNPVEAAPDNPQLKEILRENHSQGSDERKSGSDDDLEILQNIDVSLGKSVLQQAPQQQSAATKEEEDDAGVVSAKKIKIEGGRPVVARKIRAYDEMDSDDELLYNLKLAKWTDKEVQARFIAEGRTGYNHGTIGTRFSRLRAFFSKDLDRRLESGEAGWHADDDIALLQSVDEANAEVERMKQEMEKTKWELVSQRMKELIPVSVYSGGACKNRYNALSDGTASKPLEHRPQLDPIVLRNIRMRQEQEARIRAFKRDKKPE